MNKEQFDKKYISCGGIKKLAEMREKLETINLIATVFRVSGERVRQWMEELFGEHYDPRKDRRKRRMKLRKLIR